MTRGRAATALFAAAFAVYLASPVRQISDSRYSLLVAHEIATRGSLDLARHLADAADEGRFPGVRADGLPLPLRRVGARVLYDFPVGASLLAAPWVGAAQLFGLGVVDADGRYDPRREEIHQRLLAALLSALAVACVFAACDRTLSRRTALGLATAFALATPIWSTASRGLWSHTAAVVFGALALPAMLDRELGARRAMLFGAALGAAWVARPTMAIAALVFGVDLSRHDRSAAARFAAGFALPAAGLVALSLAFWDRWLPPYYASSRLGLPTPEALAGVLISPNRGLFVFEPALAAALVYALVRWRSLRDDRRFALGAIGIAAHVVAVASFAHWWGGHAYGPRLLTETVLFQVLLAVAVAQRLRAGGAEDRSWTRTLAALLVVGALIHAGGALSRQGNRWNYVPRQIDESPERLWDWSDPQWLAWLHRRAPEAPRRSVSG